MEDMTPEKQQELLARLSDLIGDLRWTNTLLEDGKIVFAHRKLQGVRAKALMMVNSVKGVKPPEETAENVAPETTEA